MSFTYTWPTYYPSKCPPEVSPRDLKVFRLANKKSITANDFKPYRVSKPDEIFSDECKACGLSVYTNKDDLEKERQDRPNLRRKHIIEISITKKSGKVMATPTKGLLR
jgi:hypothetical protein